MILALCLSWLAADLPCPCRVGDLERLPSAECVRHNLEFAAANREWLAKMWALSPHQRDTLDAWVIEIDRRVRIWETLQQVRWAAGHDEQIIVRLVVLRRLIGDDYYFAGALPDVVPVEFFEQR